MAEEKNTKCKYIRPRGRFKRLLYTGIDYTCSQNRHFFSKSSKQRSSEAENSENIRHHCTAQIFVKEFDDHVEVLYFKRHYKHDFFFYNPKLLIRRKKTRRTEKNVEKPCVYETAFTLSDDQCFSESVDVTDTSLNGPSDLCIESLMKQVDSIQSKLLLRTSIDLNVALKISQSLHIVEQLLNDDTISNNIMSLHPETKSDHKDQNIQVKKLHSINTKQKFLAERQCNILNISTNEMFVSTNPANDHDYDRT